ncbi:MAG TPA: hypothetical protein VGD64_00485 [Acidisarcina sp.]
MKLTRPRLAAALALIAVVFLKPSAARADAGIPMLEFAYPVVLVLLAPVIALEALYLRRRLGMDRWLMVRRLAVANAVSTLIGFPLAWLSGLLLETIAGGLIVALGASAYPPIDSDTLIGKVGTVILSAPWLGAARNNDRWPMVLAFLVLLVPAFFTSYYMEWWVMKWAPWPVGDVALRKILWRANLFSYLFLAVFGAIVLYSGLAWYLRAG